MTPTLPTEIMLNAISIHILHTKDDFRNGDTQNIVGISIHILHTKDDVKRNFTAGIGLISIHILHTKDDVVLWNNSDAFRISIHILHTKDDSPQILTRQRREYFNPHPSYEGWRLRGWKRRPRLKFQSTSFIRRMTSHAWRVGDS